MVQILVARARLAANWFAKSCPVLAARRLVRDTSDDFFPDLIYRLGCVFAAFSPAGSPRRPLHNADCSYLETCRCGLLVVYVSNVRTVRPAQLFEVYLSSFFLSTSAKIWIISSSLGVALENQSNPVWKYTF